MSVTRHIPDDSPGPTGSAWPGYPRGVWPPVRSSFCADRSPANTRHLDCSMPGCACSCHASRYSVGGVEPMKLWEKAKVEAIDESKQENQGLLETIGVQLEWLGTNRDSTRVPLRK